MGTRRGTNMPRMGDYNRSVILESIRSATEGLSRIEMADATGLSAQTVTNITRRLLDEGLIAEAGRTINGPGKPRVTLRLVPESRYSVGVHLDPAVITVVLLDLSGAVVGRSTTPTPEDDPQRMVESMGSAVRTVLAESGIDRGRVAGVGVAAPGPLDDARGTVVDPPKLRGWHRVALRAELGQATGLPVVLEKDTTAAAVGELWTRPGSADDSFVFLYLGTGLGAALAVDGEVVRGTSRNLGEIGHIVVASDGPACACGLRGCVAVMCAPQAIVERAHRAGILPALSDPGDAAEVDAAFTRLSGLVGEGSEVAMAVLREAAGHIAVLLSVLTNFLDVDRVVLGGPFWSRVADVYLDELPGRIAELSATGAVRAPVSVNAAVVAGDIGAVGAACVVLDSDLSPRPSVLLFESEPIAEGSLSTE